jgi:glycosyltransferase involved in cell wall biosynthesis
MEPIEAMNPPPEKTLGISLVMPAYNEGPRIRANLAATATALRVLGGGFEMIVVDDGSADNSAEEITSAACEIPELRPLLVGHAGKGEALRHGARQARGEFVIFFDADLDIPPEQILFFIAVQRAKKADAVIGSKMHPDSTVDYPLRRRFYSWGYFLLTQMLFGLPVRDTQTGLKLVRRDLLLAALDRTQARGFTLDLELLVHLVRLGARMVEAPVVVQFHMKFGGIGIGTAWAILGETLEIWQRTRLSDKLPAKRQ